MIGLIRVFRIEAELVSTANYIVDGDTFDILDGHRIRLADIDCPEYGMSGYEEASRYLSSKLYGKLVYLDIDDVYRYDNEGSGERLVCVVYTEHNASHLLNVNKALLENGHAVIDDYPNSFTPSDWRLYTPKFRIIEYKNLNLYSGISAIILTTLIYLLFRRIRNMVSKTWNRFFGRKENENGFNDSLKPLS
jgi:hypothetical protein